MSFPLLKRSFKNHWVLLLIFMLVLILYCSFGPVFYNQEDAVSFEEMLNMFPEEMMAAFGWADFGTSYLHHLAGFLYGFILIVFPVVFIILLAQALVAKETDSGAIANLLATPNSRKKIVFTKALFLVVSLALIYWLAIGYVMILSEMMHPSALEIPPFIRLNILTFCVLLFVASISFLFSCIFSDAKQAVMFTAGVPVLFILLSMLREVDDSLDGFKYATPFTLIDTVRIFESASFTLVSSLSLFAGAILLFWAAIIIFDKKSLTV